jgi:hypothetical protein
MSFGQSLIGGAQPSGRYVTPIMEPPRPAFQCRLAVASAIGQDAGLFH